YRAPFGEALGRLRCLRPAARGTVREQIRRRRPCDPHGTMTRAVALLLTFLTGFSGLVYEVTWQKYLATLLGSHSEATAAVLGLYLGGLAAGYALFGFVARRVVERAERAGRAPRLLLVYGLAEAGIGVLAFAFPVAFGAVQRMSFWVPVGHEAASFAFDVAL